METIDLAWIPPHIKRGYRESCGALHTGFNVLAAVGIRATVEAALRHVKALGGSIVAVIDDAKAKGIISSHQATALHESRLLGNEVVHELAVPSSDELKCAWDILNSVLTSVFVTPKLTKRMQLRKRQRASGKSLP